MTEILWYQMIQWWNWHSHIDADTHKWNHDAQAKWQMLDDTMINTQHVYMWNILTLNLPGFRQPMVDTGSTLFSVHKEAYKEQPPNRETGQSLCRQGNKTRSVISPKHGNTGLCGCLTDRVLPCPLRLPKHSPFPANLRLKTCLLLPPKRQHYRHWPPSSRWQRGFTPRLHIQFFQTHLPRPSHTKAFTGFGFSKTWSHSVAQAGLKFTL